MALEEFTKKKTNLEYPLDLFLEICNFLETKEPNVAYDCDKCDANVKSYVGDALAHFLYPMIRTLKYSK